MFQEIAFEYFEKDLYVIPLNGKIPLVKNWSFFSKQKPSELLLDSWCNKYPKSNVGLLTGKLSGVVAIDIDKDSALKMVPHSPVVKKGKKGETRFFKYNGEANFKRHDLGIELLSTGNQTAIPPSIHPETKEPYTWTSHETLLSYDVEDLPTLPKEFFDLVGQVETIKGDTLGRHNALIEICGAMVGRGEDATTIVDELQKYDDENHNPPYFTDKSEPHKGSGYQAALSMYMSVVKTSTQKGEFVQPKKIEIALSEKEVEEKIQKEINEASEKLKVNFPEPRGYIKELRDEILKRSHKPRPKFALASALSIVGCLGSNKVIFGDATPNLYTLFIAESGEGKDAPLKAGKKMFIETGLLHLIGLEAYRGDKSIIKRFESQRERMDIIDEASKFLRAGKSNNSFVAAIPETLTEVWNQSNDLFLGMTTASEGTSGMTFNPCLSLMSATTPNSFSETFSNSLLMQGFGGRLTFIFDDSRVKLREPKKERMSDDLDMFFSHWGNMEIETETVDISGTGTTMIDFTQNRPQATAVKNLIKPLPIQIKASDEAMRRLKELMYYFDELASSCNESIRPIAHRGYQQIKKIALVDAMGQCDPYKKEQVPFITLESVEFAFEFVEAYIKQTDSFFKDYLIKSMFHKQSTRVIEVLRRHSKGLTQRELTRKLVSQFKSSDLYDKRTGIVTNLVEAGRIIALRTKKDGADKPTTRFILDHSD